jgi:hypothetical protein
MGSIMTFDQNSFQRKNFDRSAIMHEIEQAKIEELYKHMKTRQAMNHN